MVPGFIVLGKEGIAMALTIGQEKCVNTLDKPLAVSAGAGSGKTFTLTRRIVHALESGYLTDIDQVLAITFTSKAAGEIKSRVKGALRAGGMTEQALKTDEAWISTIHGMCSRILRAHALELGLDPAFKVADEATVRTLLDASLEEVLGGRDDLVTVAEGVSPERLDALFASFDVHSAGPRTASVEGMVRQLVEAASAHPDGMASVVAPPEAPSPIESCWHSWWTSPKPHMPWPTASSPVPRATSSWRQRRMRWRAHVS